MKSRIRPQFNYTPNEPGKQIQELYAQVKLISDDLVAILNNGPNAGLTIDNLPFALYNITNVKSGQEYTIDAPFRLAGMFVINTNTATISNVKITVIGATRATFKATLDVPDTIGLLLVRG